MAIWCGSKDSKLEKTEREDIMYLLKKTETRIEFYKKLHELSQHNFSPSRAKTKQIFDILREIIEKEKKYQDKFYSVTFLHMFLKKYEKARERFSGNALMSIILDSLKTDAEQIDEFLEVDKIKLWKERYVIICIELMCMLVNFNKSMFNKYADFLANNRIDVQREPFFSKITYPLILDIKTDAGELIRRSIDG